MANTARAITHNPNNAHDAGRMRQARSLRRRADAEEFEVDNFAEAVSATEEAHGLTQHVRDGWAQVAQLRADIAALRAEAKRLELGLSA